jgi:hypothetical protein
LTHDELVERARRWLAGKQRCSVVATEIKVGYGEIADAIGWKGIASHVVECKTSRADYIADQKKQFRADAPWLGLGQYRWYMCEPDVIVEPMLPHKWGLVYVASNGVRIIRKAEAQTENYGGAVDVLLSILRRVNLADEGHVSLTVRRYEFDTRSTATLTVEGGSE